MSEAFKQTMKMIAICCLVVISVQLGRIADSLRVIATPPMTFEYLDEHNSEGGYIPSCEELEGLLGDDC